MPQHEPRSGTVGVPKLDDGQLAYLAGVLDTRAVVRTRLVAGSAGVLPYVAVSCGDAELLRWLGELTGVKTVVTSRGYDKHRCLEHCDQAHEHVRSVSGRWSVTGTRATVVLSATAGWVRFHRQEWDRALQAGMSAERKNAVAEKMVHLGWPLPVGWATQ